MIKYRYALDRNDNLVDITNLERAELTKTDRFYSIDFKQELIPRLGHINQKHFAKKHNNHILGNGETYLHALGKKIFFDEYSKCLQNNTSFNIKYHIKKYCNRLQNEYNITCRLEYETGKFDLAKYFTEILIEKPDNIFIPDILLLNPNTKEKIYIEIAVTHSSSDDKKYSGHRIIEFILKTEEDAQLLIEFKNNGADNIVRYYNFKQKQKTNSVCTKGNCIRKFNFFSVSVNGKCSLSIINENDIRLTIHNYKSSSIWNILEPIEQIIDDEYYNEDKIISKAFIKYVARAYQEKIKVKNCYICRYHAQNTSWYFVDGGPIFCKFQKITCGSNDAATCEYYKIELNYVNTYLELNKDI